MPDQDDLDLGTITIHRRLTTDDDVIDYQLPDGMTVLEAIGILTMTIDTILHEHDHEDHDDQPDN